jgi:tetrapyrrole methylase family protein / MazG family protein
VALRTKSAKKKRRNAQNTPRTARARDGAAVGKLFEQLVTLQKRLRASDGCPWDQEQTHQSLRPFLIEEAYEVLDALDGNDAGKIAEELGDLLLQIVFHAELAREAGKFDIGDVIRAVHAKMVRRHPHVFGKVKARDSAAVLKNWEQLKAEERDKTGGAETNEKSRSILSGVPRGLPALLEGYQLTRRASNIGFDWENAEGIFDKIDEEVHEVREALGNAPAAHGRSQLEVEAEIGDLLFSVVNLARFNSVDPERALKRSNDKFFKRFRWMERETVENGRRLADVPRGEMEELWNESKVRA